MQRDEKIILGVCAAALVAIVIWHRKDIPSSEMFERENDVTEIGVSLSPTLNSTTRGPSWLMSNSSFGFGPNINGFLPTITVGQEGQTVQNPLAFVKRIGVIVNNKLTGSGTTAL